MPRPALTLPRRPLTYPALLPNAASLVGSLVAWWPARGETYNNGDSVTVAHDQSGNGFHLNDFASGNAPLFVTNAINGLAAYNFLAATNRSIGLISSGLTGCFSGATPTSTVVCVVQPRTALTNGNRVWCADSSTAANPFYDLAMNTVAPGTFWLAERRSNTGAYKMTSALVQRPKLNTTQIIVTIFDGTKVTTIVNGVVGFPTTIAGTATINQFHLGAERFGSTTGSGAYLDGYIPEAVIYNAALTLAQGLGLTYGLASLYGVTLANGGARNALGRARTVAGARNPVV